MSDPNITRVVVTSILVVFVCCLLWLLLPTAEERSDPNILWRVFGDNDDDSCTIDFPSFLLFLENTPEFSLLCPERFLLLSLELDSVLFDSKFRT
eukprot:3021977-Prorocentrum_lima.AAC.1